MIVDERITDYMNSLVQELPPYLRELEKTALMESIPIIRKETQTFLKVLISMKQPKRILEVGTAVGFSSLFMSEYMPEGCSITTIEKMPLRLEKAKKNFMEANLGEKVTLLEGDALIILSNLAKSEPFAFDFIFMDAAKAQYMNFLPEVMKLLPIGGVLITDNVLQDGTVAESRYSITRRDRTIHSRMREYLFTLTHMEEMETSIVPVGDGVTVSVRIK
ncbi:O-methyltransferase [Anaerocolumna aminovalerica]|uniref:tRNA 5-hydroxyuridine methyltransferase n=1 Tax=Anaerocolumna aminovalerica TaxID=1527 RepID=A0A1I5CZG3_9FIRM|nr:O-methyltransferase [Anaerocolumna aminovalerica]MBU5331321.1 O-methyltransferase [Anaerocolumna aminovalerica]MDU6264339.1 O-methyltransferase [Anaerocolumna aminovalerica]SFN92348.1 Predicted O-methyltransferase YrrM [Anaerocolumna aminovalerica]